jgi:hypothetical protein
MNALVTAAPAVALLLLAQGPVWAEDWGFTEWGMTASEVTAASEGKAVPCDENDCRNMSGHADRARLRMPTQSDGFDLLAVFNFDRKTDLLTAVILRPQNQRDNTRWAREQRLKLKAVYGPWKEEQWFGIPTWKWKWGDGEIRLTETTKYDMDIANVVYISKAGLDAIEADD